MLKEILLAFFFTAISDIKTFFAQKWAWASDIFFIHVWHRRHVFTAREIIHSEKTTDNAVCMFCPKTLGQVTKGRADFKVLMACLLICGFARAAEFDTVAVNKGFIYDSTVTIRIFAGATDCTVPAKPCMLQVFDGVGAGASLRPFGAPGDTLKVAYNFPRAALSSPRQNVSLAFYDGESKLKAMATTKMGFADPKPVAMKRPATPRARVAWRSLARFQVNGRAKP
jgi:hypothetical protein